MSRFYAPKGSDVDDYGIPLAKAFGAEFVITALYSFVTLAIATHTFRFSYDGWQQILIGLGFGFTYTCCLFAAHHGPGLFLSGGHLNPAVSFGFLMTGRISFKRFAVYVAAQLLGGILAAGLLRGLLPITWDMCYANVMIQPHLLGETWVIARTKVVFALIILVAFLSFTFSASLEGWRANHKQVPISVAASNLVAYVCIYPWTTFGGLNPAVAFASAIAASGRSACEPVWNDQWIFWVGPFIGGAIGSLIYFHAFGDVEGAKQFIVGGGAHRHEDPTLDPIKFQGDISDLNNDIPLEEQYNLSATHMSAL